MKRVNADIYYQRAAAMYTGVMAGFCRLHGKKSIFAAAGNPDLERNTTRLRYARDRCLYEYGLRNVDRIFVQNDEQSRLCVTNFGRVPIQIPNCYPAPTKQSSGADGHILWVSTIRKLKRPDMFLDLASALPNHRFRMIGGSSVLDANMYESFKARANSVPNVDFLGFVPYSKIDDHFDEAAIFVNTSISEGFPNTFLQAWARGIPTVSFIDSGARLDGEPIGLRVDSLGEMVAKVKGLLSDSSRREQEGQRCAAYFKQHHSPERIVDLYEQAFQELLKNGPRFARRKRSLGECVESGNSER
jgi:glycosyltransferase involved in cell wall biosynthesis